MSDAANRSGGSSGQAPKKAPSKGGFWDFIQGVAKTVSLSISTARTQNPADPGARMEPVRQDRRETHQEMVFRQSEGAAGTAPAARVDRERKYVARAVAERGGKAGAARIPQGGGAPLPSSVQSKMSSKMGADLSGVRVHTGGDSAEAAGDLGARAFTVGSDVHFNSGEFAPGSKEGDRLLAHELTHVVQAQKSGIQRKEEEGGDKKAADSDEKAADGDEQEVSDPDEPAEKEADEVGDKVADSMHGDEKGGDEKGGDEKGGDEKGGDEKGGDEKAGDEKAGDEKAGDEKAGDEKSEEPKKAAPAIGAKLAAATLFRATPAPRPAATPQPPEVKFAAQLNVMQSDAKTYSINALKSAPDPIKNGDWAGAKTHLLAQPAFMQIINESSNHGSACKALVVAGVKKIVTDISNDAEEPLDDAKITGDTDAIIERSRPKLHAKAAPYTALFTALVEHCFTKASPAATISAAYAYDTNTDVKAIVDPPPPTADALVNEYNTVVVALQRANKIKGNAEGLRNQYTSKRDCGKYQYAHGFATQMQRVLLLARNVDTTVYPQLSGVEVQGNRCRLDVTAYETPEDRQKDMNTVREVKNWTGFARWDAAMQAKKLGELRVQLTANIRTQSVEGGGRVGGVIIQFKDAIPPQCKAVCDDIHASIAVPLGKFVRSETFS